MQTPTPSNTDTLDAENDEADRLERIGDWLLETDWIVEYDGDISTCQNCGQYWDGIVHKACPSCGGHLG